MTMLAMSEFVSNLTLEYRKDGKWDFTITIKRHPADGFNPTEYWTVETSDNSSQYFEEPYEAENLYEALAEAREIIEDAHGTVAW